jgi:hypothetical protein
VGEGGEDVHHCGLAEGPWSPEAGQTVVFRKPPGSLPATTPKVTSEICKLKGKPKVAAAFVVKITLTHSSLYSWQSIKRNDPLSTTSNCEKKVPFKTGMFN